MTEWNGQYELLYRCDCCGGIYGPGIPNGRHKSCRRAWDTWLRTTTSTTGGTCRTGTPMADQQWRPVPVTGYDHAYSVSDHHQVRNEQRLITHDGPWRPFSRTIKERILKAKPDGYVTLSVDNIPKCVRIADLVRQAFET